MSRGQEDTEMSLVLRKKRYHGCFDIIIRRGFHLAENVADDIFHSSNERVNSYGRVSTKMVRPGYLGGDFFRFKNVLLHFITNVLLHACIIISFCIMYAFTHTHIYIHAFIRCNE